MKPIGCLLTVAGAAVGMYFGVLYETTVEDYMNGGVIQSQGKMQDRLIGSLIGIASCVVGIVLLAIPERRD